MELSRAWEHPDPGAEGVPPASLMGAGLLLGVASAKGIFRK